MDFKKKCFFLLLIAFAYSRLFGQEVIPLYKVDIPNSKPSPDIEKVTKDGEGRLIIVNISRPSLTVFLPSTEKANGTAVIICPGGGYWVNAYKHEGTDVARQLNSYGIAAMVLKYRIPHDDIMPNKSIGPLQDAQQAMLIVRSNARQWRIDVNKVGIMGFSAGGHLAATPGTHFKNVLVANPEGLSVRPDFLILGYPLISAFINPSDNSLQKLLGKDAGVELIRYFSNETQVTPETPPTFIVQASDDTLTIAHSLAFYAALLGNKVPAEIHIYQSGGHGFGLNNKTTNDIWMDRLANWLNENGWMSKTD